MMTTTTSTSAALPYSEPTIPTVLTLASFLLLLNTLNHTLNRLLSCGLLAQLLLGTAYGTPGAGLLTTGTQTSLTQLGYVGLILLVYEGGLATALPALRANLPLCAAVAATGVGVPFALSFAVVPVLRPGAAGLPAFAAGAALCSTSLGTTFAVLSAAGLGGTRLGVVLSGAAMMDDVVGLVVVKVIGELGGRAAGEVSAAAVLRPVLVSVGFAVGVPLGCWGIVRPLMRWVWRARERCPRVGGWLRARECALVVHVLVLVGLVAASGWAGTSDLFAAYLAGAAITWWDGESERLKAQAIEQDRENRGRTGEHGGSIASSSESGGHDVSTSITETAEEGDTTGVAIYESYLAPADNRILKPFFFASIGFSIPVTRMFEGQIVWKGVVYAVFMLIGKLACGIWLVRFQVPYPAALGEVARKLRGWIRMPCLWGVWGRGREGKGKKGKNQEEEKKETKKEKKEGEHEGKNAAGPPSPAVLSEGTVTEGEQPPLSSHASDVDDRRGERPEVEADATRESLNTPPASPASPAPSHRHTDPPKPSKPLSLYPASILGLAMVARGEVGFLISSVAEAKGVFSSSDGDTSASDDELFLIVTWAIVLCTLAGPVGVGALVRRLRALEKRRGEGGQREVLGVWGVE